MSGKKAKESQTTTVEQARTGRFSYKGHDFMMSLEAVAKLEAHYNTSYDKLGHELVGEGQLQNFLVFLDAAYLRPEGETKPVGQLFTPSDLPPLIELLFAAFQGETSEEQEPQEGDEGNGQ